MILLLPTKIRTTIRPGGLCSQPELYAAVWLGQSWLHRQLQGPLRGEKSPWTVATPIDVSVGFLLVMMTCVPTILFLVIEFHERKLTICSQDMVSVTFSWYIFRGLCIWVLDSRVLLHNPMPQVLSIFVTSNPTLYLRIINLLSQRTGYVASS